MKGEREKGVREGGKWKEDGKDGGRGREEGREEGKIVQGGSNS